MMQDRDRYTFVVPEVLPVDDAERLRAIPGVHVWKKRPVVTAPLNAGWLVENALGRANLVKAPDTRPRDVDEGIARAAADLQPGILTDFMLPFQHDVVCARIRTNGGHVFAPAGSGKTLIAIVWGLAAPGPLVVVTKARARRQWLGEIRRFTTVEPFGIFPASDYRKRDTWRTLDAYLSHCQAAQQRPVIVMGWEGMHAHLEPLLAALAAYDVSVVFDESHKGRAAKRATWAASNGKLTRQSLGNVSELAASLSRFASRRLTTSASPIVNRLIDLWAQLDLVEPDAWGGTATRFAMRYCNAYRDEWGALQFAPPGFSCAEELENRMRFTAIRVPYAVLAEQLPPRRRVIARIAPGDQTALDTMPRAERNAYRASLRELGGSLQSSHTSRVRFSEILRMDAAERKRGFIRDHVPEWTTTGKGKVLIFTGRKRACDTLHKSVRGAKRDLQVWVAHGDTDASTFAAIHTEYMAHPGPCVLIGTYQAWGESLNLQDTDHMVVAMVPITPGEIEQMEGRGARLGQSRPLTITYVLAENTIDERLAAILLDKLPAVERVTGETAGVAGLADTLRGTDDLDGLLCEILSTMDEWGADDADAD